MISRYINQFIQKVSNARNAGAKEIKLSISEAESVVLELSHLITEKEHIITLEDIKQLLKNNHSSDDNNIKISGGKF